MGDTLTFKDLKPGQFFHLLDNAGRAYKGVYLRVRPKTLGRKYATPDEWGGGHAVQVTGTELEVGTVAGYFNSDDPVKLVKATFQ